MKQPEIGKTVSQLRDKKGMTQERLAELCEVSTRTIHRIENGEVNPRTFTMNNLSNILEFDFNDDYKSNDMVWIIIMHLSSMFCIVLIPIIIWSFKKKLSNEINNHGRGVINFQITMTILLICSAILQAFLLPALIIFIEQNNFVSDTIFILTVIPMFLMICIGLICFFQGMINVIKTVNDKPYKYVPSFPFLK
jgi:uncharacterized Tic20 family protein